MNMGAKVRNLLKPRSDFFSATRIKPFGESRAAERTAHIKTSYGCSPSIIGFRRNEALLRTTVDCPPYFRLELGTKGWERVTFADYTSKTKELLLNICGNIEFCCRMNYYFYICMKEVVIIYPVTKQNRWKILIIRIQERMYFRGR
jgi:hypothetical protein